MGKYQTYYDIRIEAQYQVFVAYEEAVQNLIPFCTWHPYY